MASPKVPDVVRASFSDIGGGRYPKALLVATVCWLLLAVVLFLSRLGAPEATDAQETNVATGVQAVSVPTPQDQWFVPWLPVLGALVLISAVALFVGVGLFRIVLALLGLLAVIGLASAASWLAIPAAVLWVIGCIGSLFISSHRYLTARRPGVPASSETNPSQGRTTP